MSNKLVEHQESKEILTGNQKKILFWICFIILSIAFITVWINILLTSKAFNTQMEEMVLGEDYYMEDIVITGKRAEDASADTLSQNYFFYYNNGKVNDYHKRMQVPEFVYSEYDVGDIIIMSMSHPYLIGSDIQGDLSGKIRKKIVIPQHNIYRAFCSSRQGILTPLRITAVDHHIRMMHFQHFEIILVLFMGITYDQYFHIS